ncbi:deoxyribose-phosphate aldolase [uncultured Fenollaria sp.]|uniref:deoxyribose-phosphate aldolase n=1 Tax=uncultured Fenollaria sp. TaxID=1686315 RepID=UPI0025EBF443|nr:deoxyribose-phosphate aldolase [uncultured Fenollaria sp.]
MLGIAKFIDQTNLKQDASEADIIKLVEEQRKYKFRSICIAPSFLQVARKNLQNIYLTTVISFPNGYASTEAKIFEAKDAIKNGADDLDIVSNIGRIKMRDYDYLSKEVNNLRKNTKSHILKFIIETSFLNKEDIYFITSILVDNGVDYVKTSTGFSKSGAKLDDVKFIKENFDGKIKIKASGGISDYKTALEFIDAGADVIGTSHGLEIINYKEI